jgi:hydroxylamine reductase (hybrid-cluster protein)
MTTLVVFKKLRQEHLKEISRRKEYPTHDKKGSALAQALGDQVTLVGVGLLLKCLTLKQLFELASKGGLEEEDEKKKRKTKNSVVKQILQKIQNLEGAQKLFTGLDNKLAKSLKETLEITEKGNDATLFIQEAEAFGLDNCFSTFDIDTLLRFAEGAGLKVDTRYARARFFFLSTNLPFFSNSFFQ